MVEHRLVAVADVLGFTQTVLRKPLDWTLRNVVEFLRKCLRHSTHQTGWPADYSPSLAEMRAQERVGVAWFSDTILLYALSDSDRHASEFVQTVAWLVFETFHGRHTPVRVGIDYDEFYHEDENSIFVGRALIGAYHLEQAQDWIGGAFTPDAASRVGTVGVDDYLIDYAVPTKDGADIRTALNWFAIPHQPWQLRFEPPGSDLAAAQSRDTEESVRRKWRNTHLFHEAKCEICRLNRTGA